MEPWVGQALLALALALLVWIALRRPDERPLQALRDAIERRTDDAAERLARELRVEVADAARGTRQELAGTLALMQQALLAHGGDVARTQNEQIDTFRVQLGALQAQLAGALQAAAQAQGEQMLRAREMQDAALKRLSDSLAEQLRALSEANERRLAEVRGAVQTQLAALQDSNEKRLEQMRATVDEKLHATLEQRLGESFRQVAERLQQVHEGLGDMRNLARDVGTLNKVLTNVKTRGIFGEVQLAGLLEQVFTPEQYATNVATVPGSTERVEFAIRLPGRGDAPLWLPIDAKFPREDYERLLDAHERADAAALEASARAIEQRLKAEARSIRDKYLAPPHTTDFAILFLPTEGLYAEALRRPGLQQALQREFKVMLAGPTTLLATLNSLQMGFRTLALEKRSAEVWEVLGAVKTEFGKFGDVLAKTRKKLEEATNQIDAAQTRTNVMNRRLRVVEALPEAQARALLPAAPEDGADDPVEVPGG
jgi:DNA recombination protein RmuC